MKNKLALPPLSFSDELKRLVIVLCGQNKVPNPGGLAANSVLIDPAGNFVVDPAGNFIKKP